MRNLKLLFYLAFVAYPLFSFSQQLPISTFYRDHPGLVNPAGVSSNYISRSTYMSVSSTIRQQKDLNEIPEAPKTQILTFEYVNDEDRNISLGTHVINDQTGAFGQTGFYGNFAYRAKLGGRNGRNILAIGISGGAVQYRVKVGEIFEGSDDLNGISWEEFTALNKSNQWQADAGLGAMLYLGDYRDRQNYYFGFSVPQIANLKTSYRVNSTKELEVLHSRHFYFTSGIYLFNSDKRTSNGDLSFWEINFWGRYVPSSPFSLDANLRYQYRTHFWIGAGAGTSKIARVETGATIGKDNVLRLGIAYNHGFHALKSVFSQTLEASASFSWSKYGRY